MDAAIHRSFRRRQAGFGTLSLFSHGVLHYYFRDKVELITYCVRRANVEHVLDHLICRS